MTRHSSPPLLLEVVCSPAPASFCLHARLLASQQHPPESSHVHRPCPQAGTAVLVPDPCSASSSTVTNLPSCSNCLYSAGYRLPCNRGLSTAWVPFHEDKERWWQGSHGCRQVTLCASPAQRGVTVSCKVNRQLVCSHSVGCYSAGFNKKVPRVWGTCSHAHACEIGAMLHHMACNAAAHLYLPISKKGAASNIPHAPWWRLVETAVVAQHSQRLA